jgi:hypothetical protein
MSMTKRPVILVPSLSRAKKLEKQTGNPIYKPIDEAIHKLYGSNDKGSLAFWISLRRELQRYSFEENLAHSIFSEAYERARKALEGKRPMPQPIAWLRLTCRNIIKEQNRLREKEIPTDVIEDVHTSFTQSYVDSDLTYSQLKQVNTSKNAIVKTLSPFELAILELKVEQKLKWEDVQVTLVVMKFGHHSLAALRKRKSRILKKIKSSL